MNNLESLLDIKTYIENVNHQNKKPITILEEIRENIIDKIYNNRKEIIEVINTKKNKENIEEIICNDIKYTISLKYFEKSIVNEKEKMPSDCLEIVLGGKKNYRIYDKDNVKKFVNYALFPNYGLTYSTNTLLSSKIAEKTLIANIQAVYL